jgi:hypothetical protein
MFLSVSMNMSIQEVFKWEDVEDANTEEPNEEHAENALGD